MKKILFVLPIVVLLAAGCSSSMSTDQSPAPQTQSAQNLPQDTGSTTATTPQQTTPPASPNSGTITLNASTKTAVVAAIRAGFDILTSNDVAKIRSYFLLQMQKPEQQTQIKAMTDAQILQLAQAALAAGKPPVALATYPESTAIWQVDGNTVTVKVQGSKGWGNSVVYQASYVNGAWH